MTGSAANNVIHLPGSAEAELDLKNRTEHLLGEIASDTVRGKKTREVMEFLRREAEDKGVADSACAKAAFSKMKSFSLDHWLSITGSIGEKEALKATKTLGVDATIIANLEFEWEGQRHECDQIIRTDDALVIVEVKNYSRDIVIDEYGVIRLAVGRGDLCYNIGERMRAKEYAIHGILSRESGVAISRENIHSVVLFTNDRSRVQDNFGAVKLCGRGTICAHIESLRRDEPVFTEDQAKAIEDCLVAAHSPLTPNEQGFDDLIESVRELVTLITPDEEPIEEPIPSLESTSKRQRRGLGEKAKIALGVLSGFVTGSALTLAVSQFKEAARQA